MSEIERQIRDVDLELNPSLRRQELMERAGSYNKSKLKVDDYLPYVPQAIQHAEELDKLSGRKPSDRWPQSLGTDVYWLAKSILGL